MIWKHPKAGVLLLTAIAWGGCSTAGRAADPEREGEEFLATVKGWERLRNLEIDLTTRIAIVEAHSESGGLVAFGPATELSLGYLATSARLVEQEERFEIVRWKWGGDAEGFVTFRDAAEVVMVDEASELAILRDTDVPVGEAWTCPIPFASRSVEEGDMVYVYDYAITGRASLWRARLSGPRGIDRVAPAKSSGAGAWVPREGWWELAGVLIVEGEETQATDRDVPRVRREGGELVMGVGKERCFTARLVAPSVLKGLLARLKK